MIWEKATSMKRRPIFYYQGKEKFVNLEGKSDSGWLSFVMWAHHIQIMLNLKN